MAAAQFGLSAATSVADAATQSSQANASARESNERYRSISEAAIESYQTDLKQLSIRTAQEDAAISQAATQNAEQAEDARGATLVRAAGAGISGASVEALLSEFSSIESENAATIARNREWSRRSISDTAEKLRADAQQRISGAAPRKTYGPSPFALALDVAGAGLQAYGDYKRDKTP